MTLDTMNICCFLVCPTSLIGLKYTLDLGFSQEGIKLTLQGSWLPLPSHNVCPSQVPSRMPIASPEGIPSKVAPTQALGKYANVASHIIPVLLTTRAHSPGAKYKYFIPILQLDRLILSGVPRGCQH